MKLISYLLGLFVLFSCQEPSVEEFTLLPRPVSIEYTPGAIKLKNNLTIAFPAEVKNEAQLLKDFLEKDFSITSQLKEGATKGDIILRLDSIASTGKQEGYMMDATSRNIAITANSPAGILYGIQTLKQVVKEKEGKITLQKATITDYPVFSWRAFMLDEARYFKGKDVVLKLLDNMSELKMNVFHWGLTNDQGWRIEIKKHPKLTEIGAWRDSSEVNHFGSNLFDGKPHGGFYTQEDIKEIVAYAAKRHITIVPEINMPGHTSAAIASYPWLGTSGKQIKVPAKFGVMYDVYNVADPNVMQFVEDVLDEVISLFPSQVIHIGGDEVKYDQWKQSNVIRQYMAKNNIKTPAELQIFFTNKISNLLSSKGRRMMGWNEITGAKLHEYQSDADTGGESNLAPGTIVHFWKGDPLLVAQTVEKGYEVVNSYHHFTYLDYSYESISLEKAYSFDPVPEGLTEEQQARILGSGCQMWGEFIPTEESMNLKVYPRIAAYAETGWTEKSNKDYNLFLKSLNYFLTKWEKEGIVYGETGSDK